MRQESSSPTTDNACRIQCITKIPFSLLPCVAADVGLEANLYANCLLLSLPSDINEP